MLRVRLLILPVAALAIIVLSSTASAQSIDFSQFFSVSTPGARANGMGRAFVGVADDASATVTNPGGLMFLTRPQVYVEFKSSFDDLPVDQFGDQLQSLRARISFLSVSAPINDRVAVAFSRHEFFGADINLPSIALIDHVRGTSYSGSVATTVRPDLKIGATISGARLTDDSAGGHTDTAAGFTVGGLWQANPMVSIGVAGTKWSGSSNSDTFVAPSQIKAGVGVTPNPKLKVAVDVVRVFYPSDLSENSTEFHLGGEYQLMPVGQNRFFVRAGVFTGKEASINTTTGNSSTDTSTTGTVGGGVVIGQQFQVDLAVLTRKEVVVSAAVRF